MPEPEVRLAATVLVLRNAPVGAAGLELLMLKRAAKLAFYGGAWVFPGGRIEPEDGDLANGLPHAARRAAARELYEEAGLIVRPEDLVGFSRWLTPPGRSRRFDAFYFAVAAPDSAVRIDPEESEDHAWLTPSAALAARARAEIELPPPTFVTLSILTSARNVAEGLAALGAETVHYIPRPCEIAEGHVYLYAGDAGYETTDPHAAGSRHRLWALKDGWRYERS